MGFCVASTRNGSISLNVFSPIVICLSCMASSKALWTLAGDLLISSARMKFAKTGPFFTINSSFFWLYIIVPTRSAGRRSGVNWILLNFASIIDASDLIASVFASPGTPSRRMWPFASSPIIRLSVRCFCPMITLFISILTMSTKELSFSIFSFKILMSAVCSIA